MLKIMLENEVVFGATLFVDHIGQRAFLVNSRHEIEYADAVKCVDNLGLRVIEIVDEWMKYDGAKNRWTKWQQERLMRLWEKGESAEDLGVKFGVSADQIRCAVDLGVKFGDQIRCAVDLGVKFGDQIRCAVEVPNVLRNDEPISSGIGVNNESSLGMK